MKPKMMLFSHVCNKSYITGAERSILLMTREWQDYYNCSLVVPEEGQLSAQALACQVSYIVQPCRLFYTMMTPGANLDEELEQLRQHSEWNVVVKLLSSQRPDMIVISSCVHALPALAAKFLGIPILWVIHEVIENNSFTPNAVALIQKYSDDIIGVSETAAASFLRCPANPHVPVYILSPSWYMHSLEPARWSELREWKRKEFQLSPADCLIGYISSTINPNKGLDHFMRMAIQINKSVDHARFVVVGTPVDKPYFKHCKEMLKPAQAKLFHFISFISSVHFIYPAMDIVVIPSVCPEGFGLTALEGLVFGKPVVVYGSGGLKEIMAATGNEPYIVEPGNVKQLTQTALSLALDSNKAKAIGERNQEMVKRAFGLGRVFKV